MTLDKPIAVVKYVDMPVDMQQDAVDLCYQGIENFKEEYEIAKYLKKEYECKYGSIWHCIVGKSFGSYISHEEDGFIFFHLHGYYVMLFKAG
ncbi:unnamed protein product [Schistosoma margrebowiei]|uniref:Dynein light chain n=2 Tax=Schistosoma margrebowiei TaxID=48269 RepID=A0AA84ZP68_9TREM|nr:unnamed protein product [Schistosoma intercalatum]CAH8469408.1 unnamed protein product [Schistosoma intercalatum]CAH8473066.1 unnamed protein product [Schistosoma margrebowiei]